MHVCMYVLYMYVCTMYVCTVQVRCNLSHTCELLASMFFALASALVCTRVRPWRIMLQKCSIMLCCNSRKKLYYTQPKLYYAYNYAHEYY